MRLALPLALCGFDPLCKTPALDPLVHGLWGRLVLGGCTGGLSGTSPTLTRSPGGADGRARAAVLAAGPSHRGQWERGLVPRRGRFTRGGERVRGGGRSHTAIPSVPLSSSCGSALHPDVALGLPGHPARMGRCPAGAALTLGSSKAPCSPLLPHAKPCG